MKSAFIIILLSTLALPLTAAPSRVRIEGKRGAYHLTVNGRPFVIRGAAGGASKALLAKKGGNSFRTWGADALGKELDEAAKNKLMVMGGHWLGHAEHGFDYTNADALKVTEKDVLQRVREYKNHPALLCWALGNEMEMNNPHRVDMWRFIDQLAAKVKAIDPNHPVCTVIAVIPSVNTDEIKRYLKNLDFIGVNSYGGCASLGARWRDAGMTLPYVVTEFGARGSWEGPKDTFGVPLEQTSTEKGLTFSESYAKGVAAELGKMCLGSYAFTWGWKVESTPTWHGMLLPDLTELASVEAMTEAWGQVKIANRCPKIGKINVSANQAKSGEKIVADVKGVDPDGDKLTWKWTLLSDTGDYDTIGLGLPMPKGWGDAIESGQGTAKVVVKLPKSGVFRLYAYCFDGNGHAAYANVPLHGE